MLNHLGNAEQNVTHYSKKFQGIYDGTKRLSYKIVKLNLIVRVFAYHKHTIQNVYLSDINPLV